MNLTDISKLPQSMRAQALADQARATAARERIMAQVRDNHAYRIGADPEHSPAPADKSPRNPVSGALAGLLPQVPGVKVKGPKVSETQIQQAVVRWFSVAAAEWELEPELLMGFPLQGARTSRNGARLKAEGMRRGTPDMLLAVPRGDCCSLWIENKTAEGKLSLHQKLMLKRLTKAGAATVVCRSAAEAQAAITAYLNLPTK